MLMFSAAVAAFTWIAAIGETDGMLTLIDTWVGTWLHLHVMSVIAEAMIVISFLAPSPIRGPPPAQRSASGMTGPRKCYLLMAPILRRAIMNEMLRKLRTIAEVVLTCAVSSLPSCASMGGGGMHYLVNPPSFAAHGSAT